jgi:hypothetical protein
MKRLGIDSDSNGGGGGGGQQQGGGGVSAVMSTANESGLNFLRRIEDTEKQHAMTPEEV